MPYGAVKLRCPGNSRDLSRSLESQAAAYSDRNPFISLYPQTAKSLCSDIDVFCPA